MIIEKTIPTLDLDENKGVGLKFPINSDGNTLFGLNYETFEQAKDNMLMLFTTSVGERLYQPEYGTKLQRMVFDSNNDDLRENVVNEIEDKVSRWLPYIRLDDIDVVFNPDLHLLSVSVQYGVNYDPTQSATFNFTISE